MELRSSGSESGVRQLIFQRGRTGESDLHEARGEATADWSIVENSNGKSEDSVLKPHRTIQSPGQKLTPIDSTPDLSVLDSAWESEEESPSDTDELDAGWDIEEERAAASDVAVGLDAAARRRAAEQRAAARKEKLRAKKRALDEKRKARSESIRSKQKKPKKRTPSSRPPSGHQGSAKAESDEPATAESAPEAPALRSIGSMTRARNSFRVLLMVVVFAAVTGVVAFVLSRR
jgi:hypothetical protein